MRKRNHVVPVRLNAKELRHLDGQVAKSGLNREEFLRSLILGAQLQTKPCEHHAELLRKIAGLCNNANQLAHVANKLYRHFFCSEMIKLQIVCHINKTLIDTVHMDIFF